MFRIGGRAVFADSRARVVGTIKAIVAGLAEAAERAQSEGGEVASMRLDVVSYRRRHDVTAYQAKPAQGLDAQLVPPTAQPADAAIPAMLLTAVGRSHAWTPRINPMQLARG